MKTIAAMALGLALLAVHLGATILYLAPVNPLTSRYIGAVDRYIHPLFTQSWLLFAPEPATDALQLWYRCQTPRGWSQWRDPVAALLAGHQKFRFTFRGKLLQIYENIPRDLINTNGRILQETPDCRDPGDGGLCPQVERKARATPAYRLARRFARDLCRADAAMTKAAEPLALQFQAVSVGAPQFSQTFGADRASRPVGRLRVLRFDPVPFKGESYEVASH